MGEYLTPCTVTLSPAVDVYLSLPTLSVGRESEATLLGRYAGGKGLNVSAALDAFGTENRAFCLLGEKSAASFLSFPHLPKNLVPFSAGGSVRENITIKSAEGETRISLPAETVDEKTLSAFFEKIPSGKRFVAFCGSAPRGVSEDFLTDALLSLKKRGALLLCDSRSLSASSLRKLRPYCIKPNEFEFSALCGNDAERAAEFSENILLTCGGKEGFFLSQTEKFRLIPPQISPVSTVGAGDSTLAGFIAGKMRGLSDAESARLAFAFGSAACLTEGTTPPEKEAIEALYQKVKIRPEGTLYSAFLKARKQTENKGETS